MPKTPNRNPSNDHNTLPPKKLHKDKVKWIVAEEVALITTLLEQKATGNVPESGFKPSVWPLVEFSVSKATPGDVRKNVLQCKTCYHKVSHFFGLLPLHAFLNDLPRTPFQHFLNPLLLMPGPQFFFFSCLDLKVS